MGQLLGGQNNEEKTSGIKNHHYNFVDFGSVYYDGSLYMDGSGLCKDVKRAVCSPSEMASGKAGMEKLQ